MHYTSACDTNRWCIAHLCLMTPLSTSQNTYLSDCWQHSYWSIWYNTTWRVIRTNVAAFVTEAMKWTSVIKQLITKWVSVTQNWCSSWPVSTDKQSLSPFTGQIKTKQKEYWKYTSSDTIQLVLPTGPSEIHKQWHHTVGAANRTIRNAATVRKGCTTVFIAPERRWLIVQWIPAVVEDISVWTVGPRRSVNFINCAN